MGGLFHSLRHPRRCYMVCAIARTGSNLLTDGLHATRRAGRPKQFFLPKFEGDYGPKHGLDPAGDFTGYVRGIVRNTRTSNNVFGFKVMGWYLENFIARLRSTGDFGAQDQSEAQVLQAAFPRLRFVQILRRDKLLQAISKARATQSGLWKIQEGNAAAAEPFFDEPLITRCLEQTCEDERTWQHFFARNSLRPLLVEYEELCRDFAGMIRRVLDYLRVRLPRGAVIGSPQTIRQTDPLSLEWKERYLALRPSAQQFAAA